MYTYIIEASNTSEPQTLLDQFSQTLNTTTANGRLGDLLCNATLNPTPADYCSHLGQGPACAFAPYDPSNIRFCGLPPKPEPALAEVAFVAEAVACPGGWRAQLLPEWEGLVQQHVPEGYSAVVLDVLCEELNVGLGLGAEG
jgi:hypothetical protein